MRNQTWVQTTFRNIKFANNIHSNGGLFMWPPGSYTPGARAAALPAVRHAELLRPDGEDTSSTESRPPRHDDHSVADGSRDRRALLGRRQRADEAYYANGIIGFDFEIGTTNYYRTRRRRRHELGAAQQPPFGDSTNDCLDNEGFHEAMEFAGGNYGMLDVGVGVRQRYGPPLVSGRWRLHLANMTQNIKFTFHEASSIYYPPRRLDPDHGLHRAVRTARGALPLPSGSPTRPR